MPDWEQREEPPPPITDEPLTADGRFAPADGAAGNGLVVAPRLDIRADQRYVRVYGAEQLIRPTGLLDPEIEIRPTRGQIDDLMARIQDHVALGQRVLVTTLTKRMSEDLADFLRDAGVKVHYLHSEIDTLERVQILRDLRLGVYDVVVGINLLREGLDLPEVALVAILDADKEGFLRSGSSLIQTIGRAARHVDGRVVMYADTMTASMKRAIDETYRRRAKQQAYNEAHGITPRGIRKTIRDINERVRAVAEAREGYDAKAALNPASLSRDDLQKLIRDLETQMKQAARELEFEKAAMLRDQVVQLKGTLTLKEGESAGVVPTEFRAAVKTRRK
ncbi:MAG: UvrB/UvrC motif-containing protein [Chloroflexi bacterium]|nr:UvrB/UvrC motif-containing protein [Chloroflexota bacterium]